MMYARSSDALVEATPGARGTCPTCDAAVIAKCGQIVTPHWAHVAGGDCDPWSEPESQWHQDWKRKFAATGKAQVEVPLGPHRADILTTGEESGVIELQHSSISLADALEREQFYGRMVWLFDMTDQDRWDRVHFGRSGGFWWKHGSRTQAALRRPIFWHTPYGDVLRVRLTAHLRGSGDNQVRVLGRVECAEDEHAFIIGAVA